MDNYFTSFRLLTRLGVNKIRATGVLNKNKLRRCTIIGDKQLQKKRRWLLSTAHRTPSKKAVQLVWLVRTTAGRSTWLFLNLVNLRDLFGVGTKLKESIFKNNNQINSTVTTRRCPADNYLFKFNNRNPRKRCEICSKFTIKTPERRH